MNNYKFKALQLSKYALRLWPVKKQKVVFNNFYGRGFGDNPKFIAEEILRQKLPYDLVWIANDEHELLSCP